MKTLPWTTSIYFMLILAAEVVQSHYKGFREECHNHNRCGPQFEFEYEEEIIKLKGQKGDRGFIGLKGNKGNTGDSPHNVAFQMCRSTTFTATEERTLPMDTMVYEQPSNVGIIENSTVVAPFTGLYFLVAYITTVEVSSGFANRICIVKLTMNGNVELGIGTVATNDYQSVVTFTQFANAGDTFSMWMNKDCATATCNKCTAFSGYLMSTEEF